MRGSLVASSLGQGSRPGVIGRLFGFILEIVFMMRASRFLSLFTLAIVSACSLKPEITLPNIPNINIQTGNSSTLSCSAVLSSAAGSSVISGQAAPIEVKATGGTAPYQILNTAIGFTDQTVISRTYTNTSNANVQVIDSVGVTDSGGHATQCNFVVTVAPVSTPSTLACTLAGIPASPAVNQNVSYVASATGGTAPYTFSNFALGTDGTIVTALTQSGAQATATGKFSTSGLRSTSIQLKDSTNTTVSCATSINVATAASVTATFAPAASVVTGNIITLTATPSGFTSTPSYTFTTTQLGVTITSNANVAQLTSNGIISSFSVLVTATAGSQSATYTVSGLGFTAPGSLACSIVAPTGVLYTGADQTFEVVANSPATDPLMITYFSTQSDAISVSQTDSSRTVRYVVPGLKTVIIQAKSKTTGALCQAGAAMSATVELVQGNPGGTLSCSGTTSPNPSYTFQYFKAAATITGGVGATFVKDLTIVAQNFPYNTANDGYWIDATSARLYFYYSGSYLIRFNIRDLAGNTGSCSTTQVVW
jgi:hypothetical protein